MSRPALLLTSHRHVAGGRMAFSSFPIGRLRSAGQVRLPGGGVLVVVVRHRGHVAVIAMF